MNKLVEISLYVEKKQELKTLAQKIKETRKVHKERQKAGQSGLEYELSSLVWQYRHLHIALSLFRGKSLEEIEKPREGNEPSIALYSGILEDLNKAKADVEQSTLCLDPSRSE